MTLGTNIRKFRNKKDMTQKDLADRLHVTPQAVSRWEADEVEPSVDTLKQMANLFDCSMDDLFGLEVKKEPVIIKEPEVVEKVIYTEATPALGVCDACKKVIKEPRDLFRVEERVRRGRTTSLVTRTYCANCKKKDDEKKEQREAERETMRKKEIYMRRVHSFIWPTILFIVLLIISIVMFTSGSTKEGVFYLIGGIGGYLLFATLILDNTFVSDVFMALAGLGFVKMPGIIFSLSVEGFIFFIVVKLFLALLSILIGVVFAAFAVALCAVLSIIGYPLGLSRNFRYVDVV